MATLDLAAYADRMPPLGSHHTYGDVRELVVSDRHSEVVLACAFSSWAARTIHEQRLVATQSRYKIKPVSILLVPITITADQRIRRQYARTGTVFEKPIG